MQIFNFDVLNVVFQNFVSHYLNLYKLLVSQHSPKIYCDVNDVIKQKQKG